LGWSPLDLEQKHMANEDVKAAARAGEPKALEELMNESLGKQGITARVIRSGELLRVTLRSNNLPDQKVAELVKKGIASIKPKGVTKVSLKGEQIRGKNTWATEWDLSGVSQAPKKATVISGKKQTKWYFHPGVIVGSVLGFLVLLAGAGSLEEEPPPKPSPIYPSRTPTELEVFQNTLNVKTPGVLASGEIEKLNMSALKERCPSLVAATSSVGINTAISALSSELRIQHGYDEKLSGNLATGLIEGCAAWVRGDRISPGEIVERSKPPLNKAEIDQWEREYGNR